MGVAWSPRRIMALLPVLLPVCDGRLGTIQRRRETTGQDSSADSLLLFFVCSVVFIDKMLAWHSQPGVRKSLVDDAA